MIDITGMRFGRLTVLRKDATRNNRAFWVCLCDCGVEKSIESYPLRHGKVVSCGCHSREKVAERNKKGKHLMSHSPEYVVWTGMKQRCENENATSFPRYGAAGITVCEEWSNSFESFLSYMGKRPSMKHTLDRIDNSKGYEPGNCRWATLKEQAANKTNTILITIDEVTDSLAGWALRICVNPQTLHQRIKRGMSPEDAITKGAPTFNCGVNDV